ncbi:MAG: hypothetical protein EXR51_04720 [Dehalococcoidia bacterium]|nr:hypothetical protein [Dehalococcoidia bacterium]
MTTPTGPGPTSMRFQLHEVLSGMLATMEADSIPDDASRLAAMFEDLAGRFPLFAPMGAGVDQGAVTKALETLEQGDVISHAEGRYTFAPQGRAHCVSSRRTLFNQRDLLQLKEAASAFDAL